MHHDIHNVESMSDKNVGHDVKSIKSYVRNYVMTPRVYKEHNDVKKHVIVSRSML